MKHAWAPRWALGADLKITNYHGKAIGAITINYRATTIIARQCFLFLLVIFVSFSDTYRCDALFLNIGKRKTIVLMLVMVLITEEGE